MIPFMLAALGSTIFWVIYGILGLIVGGALIRHIAPLTWETICTGKRPRSAIWTTLKADALCITLVILSNYFLWPVILTGIITWITLKHTTLVVLPILRKTAVKAGYVIPDFKISITK